MTQTMQRKRQSFEVPTARDEAHLAQAYRAVEIALKTPASPTVQQIALGYIGQWARTTNNSDIVSSDYIEVTIRVIWQIYRLHKEHLGFNETLLKQGITLAVRVLGEAA